MLSTQIFIGLFVAGLIVIVYRLTRWHNDGDDKKT